MANPMIYRGYYKFQYISLGQLTPHPDPHIHLPPPLPHPHPHPPPPSLGRLCCLSSILLGMYIFVFDRASYGEILPDIFPKG